MENMVLSQSNSYLFALNHKYLKKFSVYIKFLFSKIS